MTLPCPKCNDTGVLIDAKPLTDGRKYRRWECKACRYRWSDHVIANPRDPQCRFTSEVVREILLSDDDIKSLAARHNKSETAIRDILYGRSFRHLHPKIPRRVRPGKPSCYGCQQWSGFQCGMGFPDPLEEGPEFAVDCVTFLPFKPHQSHT